jgi:hypothetical protein
LAQHRLRPGRSTSVRFLAAALFAMLVLVWAGEASAADRCRRPSSSVVRTQSPRAVVWQRHTGRSDAFQRVTWGCLRSAGRRVVLHRGDHNSSLYWVASRTLLAGRFVSFAREYGDHFASRNITLQVVDLRSGRTTASLHVLNEPGGGDLANPQ